MSHSARSMDWVRDCRLECSRRFPSNTIPQVRCKASPKPGDTTPNIQATNAGVMRPQRVTRLTPCTLLERISKSNRSRSRSDIGFSSRKRRAILSGLDVHLRISALSRLSISQRYGPPRAMPAMNWRRRDETDERKYRSEGKQQLEIDAGIRWNGFSRLADTAGKGDDPGSAGRSCCCDYRRTGAAAGIGKNRCGRACTGTGGELFAGGCDPGRKFSTCTESHSSSNDSHPFRRADADRIPCQTQRGGQGLRISNLSWRDLPSMAGAFCDLLALAAGFHCDATRLRRHSWANMISLRLPRRIRTWRHGRTTTPNRYDRTFAGSSSRNGGWSQFLFPNGCPFPCRMRHPPWLQGSMRPIPAI